MEKGILSFAVTLLLYLSGVTCDTLDLCPSGHCPVVSGGEGEGKFLPGKWECAVCGRTQNEPPNEFPKCRYVFHQFFKVSPTECRIRTDYCTSRLQECDIKRTTRCQELYLMGACCVCKENAFGQNCSLPRFNEVDFSLYMDGSMKSMVDFRDRPTCWVIFVHHDLKWRSGSYASVVLVPGNDTINDLPFTACFQQLVGSIYATKFTNTITEEESEIWCSSLTNLGEYCQRFSLIFNSKENKEDKARRVIYFEITLPFYDHSLITPFEKSYTLYDDKKAIGYNAVFSIDVFGFHIYPPYFFLYFLLSDYRISNTTMRTFVNQTEEVGSTCVPRIKQSCSTLYQWGGEVFPYMLYSIKMEYRPPPPECTTTSVARWQVFKEAENIFYKPGDEIYTREGCCSLIIQPYTFDVGQYMVRLTMMHIQQGKKIYNSKSCLLRIGLDKIKVKFNDIVKFVNSKELNYVEVEAYDMNSPPKDQKTNLVYTWSCLFNGTDKPCTELDNLLINAPLIKIPQNTLKPNSSYQLSVRVHSTGHSNLNVEKTSSRRRQTLIVTSWEDHNLISLRCETCDDSLMINPQEYNVIVIRAKDRISPPFPDRYEWQFAEEVDGVVGGFHPVVDIREENGTSDIVLKIKRDVLKYGTPYVFQAMSSNSIFSRMRVTSLSLSPFMERVFNCTLNPKEGVRGVTNFNFKCELKEEDESLLFEFYDKDEKDEYIFSGRMLGYNNIGTLSNFQMTKGKLYVLVFDKHSLKKNYSLLVPLLPFNGTSSYLEGLLRRAGELSDSNQFDWPAATVSSVADVTARHMKPPAQVVRQPVLILHRIRVGKILGLSKMVLSSLKTVLINTAREFDILEVDAHITKTAAEVLSVVASNLMWSGINMKEEQTLTQTVFYEMIKAVFDCVEIIMKQKNKEFISKPEYYVIPLVSDLVQTTSLTLVSIVDTVSYSLGSQQIPGDIAKNVISDGKQISASTKVDFATNLSAWTLITENCSVVISREVISPVGLTSQLGLQYIRMRTNPFWWAQGNIVSEVLLVNICERTSLIDCRKLIGFTNFVTVILNVVRPLDSILPIEGTAYQIDPSTMEENKELKLTVYKFILPEKAKFFLKFLPNDSNEYRMTLRSDGIRPDYAEILKNPHVINAHSSDYDVPYDSKHADERIYYLGILPGSNVSVGKRVPFRLKAYYSLCNTWVRWQWTTHGCWVGPESNEETIHCHCSHLSVVAGAITTPDHHLSPATEFLLFLTPWENLLPLFIWLLIALFYSLLILWSVVKVKSDEIRGEVTVLEDNFPGERYMYLVGVYTGARLFSGTSATVGIRLYGDVDDSRSHVLKSPHRSVMSTFSEDWFLMFSPLHLGEIRRLFLWHNDDGCCPDWYVEKVEVYDLLTNTIYIFEINIWLGMEVNAYPEVYVTPVRIEEYYSTMNIFRFNFENCVKDTHIWTSVCLKHPRNPVSRVERVSAIMCFISSAMSVSLLLYLFLFGPNIDEDKPSYFLDSNDLNIFILSLISASFVTCLIMGLFRKSFGHKFNTFVSTPSFLRKGCSPDVLQPIRDEISPNLREKSLSKLQAPPSAASIRVDVRLKPYRKRRECDNLIMDIQKIARGNSLLPVRLPGTESDLIIHKLWLITAWILCVTTILISALIILLNAWKLPTIKGIKFLSVFFGIVVFDAIIVSLLKILIFSAILSYRFFNISPGTVYYIKRKDTKRLHISSEKLFLVHLLQKRQKSIYYPLSESVKEMKRKCEIKKYKWRAIIDFVMSVILVCTISVTCNVYYINRYTSNSHVARMMTAGESLHIPNLTKVFNRTDLYNFLENSFVSQLYRFVWYNYRPLLHSDQGRKHWSNDCVMRLVGNTRIRQLRVSLENCQVNDYFRDAIYFCSPPWYRDVEDKDVYSVSWRLADYKETTRERSSWRYVDATSSNSSNCYGQSGTLYHGGGYIAELGYSKRETRGTLLTLDMEGWLDHMTRAVFVELTLYNVNTDLFTQVVLVCEQQPTGQYISVPKVGSATTNIGFNFWNVGFIIFQVFFLFKALYLVNRLGVFGYLSSALNIFESYLLILGFTTVMLYVVHAKYSSHYIEEFYRRGFDEFFNFFEIIRFDFMSKAMMGFLFVCMVLKVLLSWRFGKVYLHFYYSLLLSRYWIFWLTLYFIICLVIIWRFIGYELDVYLFPYYTSPIVYLKDFKNTGVHNKRFLEHLVVYVMCFFSSLVNLLFVASFTHFFKKERLFKPISYHKEIYNFSFIEFLIEEFKTYRK